MNEKGHGQDRFGEQTRGWLAPKCCRDCFCVWKLQRWGKGSCKEIISTSRRNVLFLVRRGAEIKKLGFSVGFLWECLYMAYKSKLGVLEFT